MFCILFLSFFYSDFSFYYISYLSVSPWFIYCLRNEAFTHLMCKCQEFFLLEILFKCQTRKQDFLGLSQQYVNSRGQLRICVLCAWRRNYSFGFSPLYYLCTWKHMHKHRLGRAAQRKQKTLHLIPVSQ